MYLPASPLLIYILTIYSFVFIVRAKTKNEFLLLFTVFCFIESMNSWENSIISIITTPINFRVIDIPLLLLSFYILKAVFNKHPLLSRVFNASKVLYFFIILVFTYTVVGVLLFGYESIAEFRMLFFYIIVVLFIFSNVKKNEVLGLIKNIASYLIPLILLIPINIILTGNATISADNRTLGAFIYETITMGYIAGYFYWTYIDKNFNLFKWFLPVFLIFSIWANVRTVWAIIIAAMLFKFVFEKGKIKTFTFLSIIVLIVGFSTAINVNYLEKRTEAFTNINEDPTGKWRLLVWSAVVRDAKFLGEGIGARFKVYADVIGFDAEFGAHNGFIRILHNMGYFGVTIIIMLFISLTIKFLKAIQRTKHTPQYNMINKLSLISVFSLSLYMMGYGPDLLSWVFISFGLIYGLKKNEINLIKKKGLHA